MNKQKNIGKIEKILSLKHFHHSFIYPWFLLMLMCFQQGTKHLTINSVQCNIEDSLRPYISYHSNVLAFINVNIMDGSGSPVRRKQTLVINEDIIKMAGDPSEVEIPENCKIIDLAGMTIIPGIIGMHNHLHIPGHPDVGDIATKLYLAAGVTTIQTCGAASPSRELNLSKQIATGTKIGPDIIPSAPFITGVGGNPNMIIPSNDKQLIDTMQYWLNQGIRWFKIYRNTSPQDLKIIIDIAHQHDAKVRGHLCSITFSEAAEMGIDGIEHGLNSASDFRTNKKSGACNGGREYMDQLTINSPEVRDLQQRMIDRNVFLTSTLAIYEASVPTRAYASDATLRAMAPELIEDYRERRRSFDLQMQDSVRNRRLQKIMQFEYQYFKMGGLLCSGVDAGRHVLPGFGDQRNYILLLESGFNAEEAIQIMSGNGAMALGRSDIGMIQAGRRADFVILDGDLHHDPSVIKKIKTVFKSGIGYDPEKILNETVGKFGLD